MSGSGAKVGGSREEFGSCAPLAAGRLHEWEVVQPRRGVEPRIRRHRAWDVTPVTRGLNRNERASPTSSGNSPQAAELS